MKHATAIIAFLALAVASNLFTKRFGLVPIGFGLIAGAGAWLMGPVLVARDLVQDLAGRRVVVAVMAVAAGLSWMLATPALAVASTVAFAIAETADYAVYTPMRRRGWTRAALLSGFAGSVIGSSAFLILAGFPLARTLPGQLLVTTATTVVAVALVAVPRRWLARRSTAHTAPAVAAQTAATMQTTSSTMGETMLTTGRIRWYTRTFRPCEPPPDLGQVEHPPRRTLERILLDPHDPRPWAQLVDLYDRQARPWSTWTAGQRWYATPVVAGLAHTRPVDELVEVCCGTGEATALLDLLAGKVTAVDASEEMLAHTPALPRSTFRPADVRDLPFDDGSVPLLVGLNAIPHVDEFTRVLNAQGQLLWCSSFGPAAPLYLSPERLADLFGPSWGVRAGRAGHGEWVLLTRRGGVRPAGGRPHGDGD